MDSGDDEFLRELHAAFETEADEHLQAMSTGLLALEQAPPGHPPAPVLESVFREAHSLKGAARAVNRADIESVCQALETVFAAWKRGGIAPTPGLFDILHHALDLVGELRASGEANAADKARISALTHQLAAAGKEDPAASAKPSEPNPAAEEPNPAASGDPSLSGKGEDKEGTAFALSVPAPPPLTGEGAGGRGSPASPETVRISVAKLDALLRQAEEMLTVKMTAALRASELRDTQTQALTALGRWKKKRAGLAPETLPAPVQEFLAENQAALQLLEDALAALARSAEQDHRDMRGKVDTLLEDAKKLLMLPFATLTGTFPKMVRDLARDEGKDVQLMLEGGGVEIDKRILEKLKDPLTHLLRNSVDHGIETPEERARTGKPARATVTLAAAPVSGSEVEIRIADDGAGIDTARVKASAVKHGLITEEAAGLMSDAQAIDLIFASDISTSPIITEISGRGLGMAIVRENVERLGGRVQVETKIGQGTVFRLRLPLTLATFKGILVRVGDQTFVVPTTDVGFAGRVRPEEIQTVENRETVLLKGRLLSFMALHDVLGIPRPLLRREEPSLLPFLVLGAADKEIAFRVDAILDEQEVLVKPLGRPLLRVRHIAGAAILGSGKPAAVLHAADLLQSATRNAASPPLVFSPAEGASTPRQSILIAEDSITSRMLLKNILEAAGYQVTTAVDGLDALTILKTQAFSLVVSDVDMPRLNGFELTARIREDPALQEMPVVLVTARDTREDRERGVDVGASAYLVKSSFDQSNLLATIERLI